jgi:hypothetical protein
MQAKVRGGPAALQENEIRAFRKSNPRGTRARLTFEIDLCTSLWIEDLPEVTREQLLSGQISNITGKSRSHVVLPVSREAALLQNSRREGFTTRIQAVRRMA